MQRGPGGPLKESAGSGARDRPSALAGRSVRAARGKARADAAAAEKRPSLRRSQPAGPAPPAAGRKMRGACASALPFSLCCSPHCGAGGAPYFASPRSTVRLGLRRRGRAGAATAFQPRPRSRPAQRGAAGNKRRRRASRGARSPRRRARKAVFAPFSLRRRRRRAAAELARPARTERSRGPGSATRINDSDQRLGSWARIDNSDQRLGEKLAVQTARRRGP